MKYRVWAKSVSYVYLDVVADSIDDAIAVADETDGGDFTSTAHGDWEIYEAVPIADG